MLAVFLTGRQTSTSLNKCRSTLTRYPLFQFRFVCFCVSKWEITSQEKRKMIYLSRLKWMTLVSSGEIGTNGSNIFGLSDGSFSGSVEAGEGSEYSSDSSSSGVNNSCFS